MRRNSSVRDWATPARFSSPYRPRLRIIRRMIELNTIQLLVILAPPLLLAITLHEVAHGWVALLCGDTTAKGWGGSA
jgi:hypothetical protein